MTLTLSLVMAPRKKTTEDPHKVVNLALGKRLAHLRTLRGLSQRELAERVNVVQVVVSNYEVGPAGVPVDMDVALQQDGSLVATRVSVISTGTTTLTVVSGPLMTVSSAVPVTYVIGAEQQGYLPTGLGGFGYVNFGNSQFEPSDQFKNLASLPFKATF